MSKGLRCFALALGVAALAGSAAAQPPQRQGPHMSPQERQRLRDDMNAARRDVYRDSQPQPQRPDMPPPGGRMSPEDREKLRRDLMDANRGMPRR